MPSPTPTAKDFFLGLIETRATGEPVKVGTTVIRPDREWPTSSSALWMLALDMAAAEQKEKAA